MPSTVFIGRLPLSNVFFLFFFGCVSAVVNNPCVKILTVENVTDEKLILDFNTNMSEELGIYTLQDNSSSEYGDLGVGDICSLSSEASEEEIHENRKRCVTTWSLG